MKRNFASLVSYDSSSDSSLSDEETDISSRISSKTSKGKLERKTLPLPDSIRKLFPSESENDGEKSGDHQGRVRSFPHMRGNWATCVLISVRPDVHLLTLIDSLQKCLRSVLQTHVMDDLHISVSRTFTIPYHCIEPLTNSLRKRLQAINRFVVEFQSVQFYTNDECTRSFVGLKVGAGETTLKKVTDCVDLVLKDFNLPVFYKDPSYHISVCWALGDVTDDLHQKHLVLQNAVDKLQAEDPDSLSAVVSEIQCKTGNKVFTFDLAPHR